eukprot:IDg23426t1
MSATHGGGCRTSFDGVWTLYRRIACVRYHECPEMQLDGVTHRAEEDEVVAGRNGAFMRRHEASEEAISATDINSLPMLSAEDIPLQSAITTFCVDFETKNKPQTNADGVRRKRAASSETADALAKRGRRALVAE